MKRISEKTKQKQGRGTGEGAAYKPYIKVREVPSEGTSRIIKDKKDGRQRQFLSQGEVYAYYLLRWDESVIDIREQYPLELEDTVKIADALGFAHPCNRETTMTTDILVTYLEEDGTKSNKAYSIKVSKDVIEIKGTDTPSMIATKNRTVEKLRIEMGYWKLQNIPFELVFKDNINRIKVSNIEAVMDYWNIEDVKTQTDLVKHLIVRKKIVVDMESNVLVFNEIADKYKYTLQLSQELL
jgi:hypothetical protein